MHRIKRRLERITKAMLDKPCDPTSERGIAFNSELRLLQEVSKTLRQIEGSTSAVDGSTIKVRAKQLTEAVLKLSQPTATESDSYVEELKMLQSLIKTWDSFDGVDMPAEEGAENNRRSLKTWDNGIGTLTTDFKFPKKMTERQAEAMRLMDNNFQDKVLLLGGSGSGKSFIQAYKIVRDVLRYKAPCLIARDKMIDLTQGMQDQIIPAILQLIAEANGQERWDMWSIDGLKFAKWSDKHSRIDFATGGYIRFAGLSARDLSESGSDKILSPSWFHVMLEEISELDYEITEKVLTRLRYHVDGVLNKLLLCENPPSVNHWSYRRFIEHKRLDGTEIDGEEMSQHVYLLMNPQDNVENLGETYVRNLSQMSGANRERFYLGQFQDSESGEIFRRIQWTDNLPASHDWDRLIVYTDPTPLTGKDYSPWADYKASVLCGLFKGETYVIDVRLVRGSTLDMLTNIKQLWDVSPNQAITEMIMEKKQVPSDFNQVMNTFSTMTGWVCPIRMDTRIFTDKKASIETFLQPMFEQDMIFFNKAFRDTERGRQTQVQVLKFSRKSNKTIHDDIPDAIMRADTFMKGRKGKLRKRDERRLVGFVSPAYVHRQH